MRYSVAIILFIGALAVGWFYIQPAWDEVNELTGVREEYDDALTKVEDFKQLREDHIAKYNALPDRDIERLHELLPDRTDHLWLLMNLDAVAAEHNVEIANLDLPDQSQQASDEEGNQRFATTEIGFEFEADYDTLVNFLTDLESRLRLLDVTSLRFTATDIGEEYNYRMTVQTYSLQQ